jgi:Ni,Fe-hydrogenase III small subunit
MSARLEKLLLRALVEKPATIAGPSSGDKAAKELATTLQDSARRLLGRALSIREVDAGSCNGCELEIHALNNPVYDLERFGLKFVASPRHADVLMVTGPVTANMKTALERTYNATPAPKWVVALGDCACTGGLFKGSYACIGAVEDVVPVDLRIPGCPPRPVEILSGLIALIEMASR